MNLFLTEARRDWLLLLRYPYQTLFANTFLLLLYFAFRQLPASLPGSLSPNSETTVVGYIMWTTLAICLAHVSSEIERDIQAGTMNRMLLSGYPLIQIAAVRSLLGLTRVVFSVGFVLLGLLLLGEIMPPVSTLLAATSAAAVLGSALGLVFGGLALILRPVAMLQMPLCLLLLVAVAAAGPPARDLSLSEAQIAALALTAAATLWILSLAAFYQLERMARRAGTIARS